MKTVIIAVAAAAALLAPSAHAGSWTAVVPCNTNGSDSRASADDYGFHNQFSGNEFKGSSQCAAERPWNTTDAASWGNHLERNGLEAIPRPGYPRYDGAFTFKAPGNATPADEPFRESTRITRIAYYHPGGGPSGSAYTRGNNRYYTLGLFATDASRGALRNELINGCMAGDAGPRPSAWPGQPASSCGDPVIFSVVGRQAIDVPRDRDVKLLHWLISCDFATPGCANNRDQPPSAQIFFSGVKVTLEDTTAPTTTLDPGGLNSADRAVGGKQPLSFDARDVMGLDRAELIVDGRGIGRVDWPCGNRNGQEGPSRLPCGREGGRLFPDQSIVVDTPELLNGRHAGLLRVWDALGNRRDVPFSFRTFNASVDRDRRVERRVEGFSAAGRATEIAPSGRRGGARKRRSGVTLRRWSVGPGASSRPRIRGVLRTSRRRPIGRAKLAVFVRDARGLYQRKRDITTTRRGRFAYRLARGASRDVTFVYRGGKGRRGAIAEVAAKVRARVTIHASRRSVANRTSVTFSGRVPGRPLPRRGVLVELQAFERGRWRTFQQTRTHAGNGAWRSTYRFETIGARTTYRFRARVRGQSGFPYSTGISRHVNVTVRG